MMHILTADFYQCCAEAGARHTMLALTHLRKRSAGIQFTRFIATASIFKSNAARKSPTPIVFLEGLGTPQL